MKEAIPLDALKALEKEFLIRLFVDTYFVGYKLYRRSSNGSIVLIDIMPDCWLSTKQSACETIYFGIFLLLLSNVVSVSRD